MKGTMSKKLWSAILAGVVVIALAVTIPLYVLSSPNIATNEPGLSIRGDAVMTLKHADGSIETHEFKNAIVLSGFEAICHCVGNPTQPDNFDYIAVGTGTTAVAEGDTTLGSELARKLGTYAHTAATKEWMIKVTFSPGEAIGAITESGVFNAAAAGTMLCRQTFAVVNKGANDTLEITWKFTLSQG